MGIWDAFLNQFGGGGGQDQIKQPLKPNTFYSLSQIAQKKQPTTPPRKKKPLGDIIIPPESSYIAGE